VVAGREDLFEVSPQEASGSTVTEVEVFKDMAPVLPAVRKTSDQLSATRTLHRVQVPMQSHAQAMVGAEVADALCVGRLAATAATTS